MDEVQRARRQRGEFISNELRLAHIYLNIAENPVATEDTTARHMRHAGQILSVVNRLVAEDDLDEALEADIVAERDRLQERFSRLAR